MKINITKKQYKNMLVLVYLGEFMANGWKVPGSDEWDTSLDGTAQYIYSFADQFGFGDLVEYDKERDTYYPTRQLDEDPLVREAIEGYDEDCFWQELFHRLSRRDFRRDYSDEQIKDMEMGEYFSAEEPYREKWGEEIDTHGINRLEIDDQQGAKGENKG